jgi:cation diffusion facilitator family transporter
MDSRVREKRGLFAVYLGMVANVILAGFKTVAGVLGHSPALLSDGINSTSDVVYYIVVSIFVRRAAKPADREHPYGHRQLESISALVVGAFVMTAAVVIFWDSVNDVYDLFVSPSHYGGTASYTLWIALGTVVIKIILHRVTRRIGRQIDNPAILALASDHRNDIFSASAATMGIFFGREGFPWLDPLAGALVALVVLHTGIEILRNSASDLMDTIPGNELARQILDIVRAVPGVIDVQEIHAHRFGPFLVVNITIGLDASLTVAEGDVIATAVEDSLVRRVELVRRVYVHYHPPNPTTSDGLPLSANGSA